MLPFLLPTPGKHNKTSLKRQRQVRACLAALDGPLLGVSVSVNWWAPTWCNCVSFHDSTGRESAATNACGHVNKSSRCGGEKSCNNNRFFFSSRRMSHHSKRGEAQILHRRAARHQLPECEKPSDNSANWWSLSGRKRRKLADVIHGGHLCEGTVFSQTNFLFAAKPRNEPRSHQTRSACVRTATITIPGIAPLTEAADQERWGHHPPSTICWGKYESHNKHFL